MNSIVYFMDTNWPKCAEIGHEWVQATDPYRYAYCTRCGTKRLLPRSTYWRCHEKDSYGLLPSARQALH
uniref:Uncharacterized protein n=1 Tax=viral metagenome TaxID=1070528 RepID=A0A6H1Z9T3_9ZZZZ